MKQLTGDPSPVSAASKLVWRARAVRRQLRRRWREWHRSRAAAAIGVRQATQADVDEMLRFWDRVPPMCIPDVTALRLRRVMERAPHLVLVVEQRGEIVATAVGTHDSFRAYLYGFAVDPAHRRRGIGSVLLGELEHRLLMTDYHALFALVLRDDPIGAGFCHALGYIEFEPRVIYQITKPMRHREVTGVTVRRVKPSDIERVVQLWAEADLVDDPGRSGGEALAMMTAFPDLFVVAEIDGVLVGATTCCFDGMQSWGYRQVVSPAHRRRGVATAMAVFREPARIALDEPWRGGMVLESNSDAAGFASSRETQHRPEWAYMRRGLRPR